MALPLLAARPAFGLGQLVDDRVAGGAVAEGVVLAGVGQGHAAVQHRGVLPDDDDPAELRPRAGGVLGEVGRRLVADRRRVAGGDEGRAVAAVVRRARVRPPDRAGSARPGCRPRCWSSCCRWRCCRRCWRPPRRRWPIAAFWLVTCRPTEGARGRGPLVGVGAGPVADGLGVTRVGRAGAVGRRACVAQVVRVGGRGPQQRDEGPARQREGEVPDEPAARGAGQDITGVLVNATPLPGTTQSGGSYPARYFARYNPRPRVIPRFLGIPGGRSAPRTTKAPPLPAGPS